MGKISVEAFLKEFKVASKQKDSVVKECVDKHIATQYIPILEKDVYCNSIINASCYRKEEDKEYVKFNSVARFIGFTMRLISLYTDIEIDFNDGKFVNQYDELNKVGAIEYIIESIPVSEYAEFSTILNMKLDDLRDNEYSITALLYNLKQNISLSGEALAEVLDSPEVKKAIEEIKNSNN